MAITRERKEALVAQYKELISNSTALVITTYSGLSVKDLQSLRHKIRETDGQFHIVKNNLVERAFNEVGTPLPEGALVGPTAIGFANEDVLDVAKAIVELARESDLVRIKGAVIEGLIYTEAQIMHMAELPPMPVVQAQLLSVVQAPASRIAGVLASSVRQVVNVLRAYSEAEATVV